MKDKQLAAMNISLLAAYEMYYGAVPKELVAHVYDKVSRLDYFTPNKVVIDQAKAAALFWLAAKLETPDNSGGTPPAAVKPRQGAAYGTIRIVQPTPRSVK